MLLKKRQVGSHQRQVVSFVLYSELNVSSVDQQLSVTIARNVAKTVQLYCVKCEQMVSWASFGSTTT